MGVAQTVDRNDRDIAPLAVTAQNIINGRVVDLAIHKNRLIVRQTFYKLGKTDNRLPINLNLQCGNAHTSSAQWQAQFESGHCV